MVKHLTLGTTFFFFLSCRRIGVKLGLEVSPSPVWPSNGITEVCKDITAATKPSRCMGWLDGLSGDRTTTNREAFDGVYLHVGFEREISPRAESWPHHPVL